MKISSIGALFVWLMTFGFPFIVGAQDLGAGFTKVKDDIYVFAPDATTTTCSFVVTQEGVDSCNSPLAYHNMLAAIKKVTDKPIVFLIDTETHSDHTANHFIFSPPATIINHEGAAEAMKKICLSTPIGMARTDWASISTSRTSR